MTFSLIVLGSLLILTVFNVGESVYEKLRIKKWFLIIALIITIVLFFVPNIKIGNTTFTWVGFWIPAFFSAVVLLKVQNLKLYFRMFVNVLLVFSLCMIFNLMTFDVYESQMFQPYLILAIILGVLGTLFSGNVKRNYASTYIGLIISELVFYKSRYSVYGDYYLTLGNEKVLAVLLVGFVTSLLTYFLARKIKLTFVRRKLAKLEREKEIA